MVWQSLTGRLLFMKFESVWVWHSSMMWLLCCMLRPQTVPVYGMDSDISVLLQRSFPELAKRYARMVRMSLLQVPVLVSVLSN